MIRPEHEIAPIGPFRCSLMQPMHQGTPKGRLPRDLMHLVNTLPALVWDRPRRYFLALSAAAASLAVGTVPPAAWVMLISDSPDPAKTSSMRP